jgi:hypothetical protein
MRRWARSTTRCLEGLRGALSAAAGGIAAEQGAVGAAERRDRGGAGAACGHAGRAACLARPAEEVDPAAAMAELRAIQTRLEASYQATSMVANLSLAALLR